MSQHQFSILNTVFNSQLVPQQRKLNSNNSFQNSEYANQFRISESTVNQILTSFHYLVVKRCCFLYRITPCQDIPLFKKNTKQTSLPLIKSLPLYLDLFPPFQLKPKTQFLILDLIVDEERLHRAFYIVEFHESDYGNCINTAVPEDVCHIATYLERISLAKASP